MHIHDIIVSSLINVLNNFHASQSKIPTHFICTSIHYIHSISMFFQFIFQSVHQMPTNNARLVVKSELYIYMNFKVMSIAKSIWLVYTNFQLNLGNYIPSFWWN